MIDPLVIVFGLVDIPKWTIVAVPALVGLVAYAITRLRTREPEVVTA